MADLKLFTTIPDNIMLGSGQVTAVYCGDVKVWPSTFVGCPPYGCNTNVDPTGCTNLSSAWLGCLNLTSFPFMNVSAGTNFYSTWKDCSNLVTFPAAMFNSCTAIEFTNAWRNCALDQTSVDNILVSLDTAGQSNGTVYLDGGTSSTPSPTGFTAKYNLEARGWTVLVNITCDLPPYFCNTAVNPYCVTNFNGAWYNCTSLTSFPGTLDLSSGLTFYVAWANCTGLTSFPGTLDLSSGTDFTSTWLLCTSLTSFPETLNLSSGTYFDSTWNNCTSLTSFPGTLNLSSGTSFSGAWTNCNSLTSFPGTLNLSSGTNFQNAWGGCSGLTSFPGTLNLSSGTNFNEAWNNCTSLTSFPALVMSSPSQYEATWLNCSSLTEFPAIDFSNGTWFQYAWRDCTSLTTFPPNLFDTCTATTFFEAWYNCALDQASVDNILVSLDTAGQLDGYASFSGGTSATPGAAGILARGSLVSKGWIIVTN